MLDFERVVRGTGRRRTIASASLSNSRLSDSSLRSDVSSSGKRREGNGKGAFTVVVVVEVMIGATPRVGFSCRVSA